MGSFATQAWADALRAELAPKGYTGVRTVYTGEDGGRTTGPWVVHVAALSDAIHATSSDGAERIVDGKNRKPGLIRGCGGEDDAPTQTPKHDFTCTDETELIQFTPIFGASTEPEEGAEAVLHASGRVSALREGRGGTVPPDGSVLSEGPAKAPTGCALTRNRAIPSASPATVRGSKAERASSTAACGS